jgi:hypothetical protein
MCCPYNLLVVKDICTTQTEDLVNVTVFKVKEEVDALVVKCRRLVCPFNHSERLNNQLNTFHDILDSIAINLNALTLI